MKRRVRAGLVVLAMSTLAGCQSMPVADSAADVASEGSSVEGEVMPQSNEKVDMDVLREELKQELLEEMKRERELEEKQEKEQIERMMNQSMASAESPVVFDRSSEIYRSKKVEMERGMNEFVKAYGVADEENRKALMAKYLATNIDRSEEIDLAIARHLASENGVRVAMIDSGDGLGLGSSEFARDAGHGASVEDMRKAIREAKERKVLMARMVRRAQHLANKGHLIVPEGENAFEVYERILSVEPGNKEALDGLAYIAERYLGSAKESIAEGNLNYASLHFSVAEHIVDKFGVESMREQMMQVREDLAEVIDYEPRVYRAMGDF